MKAALLSFALLGSQPAVLISDRVPQFNVEAVCRAAVADDKANGIVLGQPFENCMRDETAAQQQLSTLWQANTGPVRDRCEREAAIGDTPSYVDLLTCMEMAGLTNSPSSPAPLRGASKNRNSK
jgi:hypothetical protein